MRFPITFFRYLIWEFSKWLLIVLAGLISLIFLFDAGELIRRFSSRPEVHIGAILEMVFLKLPHIVLTLLPFVILFSSLLTLWRFCRHHEIIIVRASGLSLWHILAPLVGFVFFIGLGGIFLINPIASSSLRHHNYLEAKHFKGQTSLFSISENGLWVRQADDHSQFILHANHLVGKKMTQVSLYEYDTKNKFIRRIDAEHAYFEEGFIDIKKAWIAVPDQGNVYVKDHLFRTSLTLDKIQESTLQPENISFWNLTTFIHLLEKSGLSSVKYRLYWHTLVSNIVLLVVMCLLGAGLVLSFVGRGHPFYLAGISVGIGLILFFIRDVSYALGLSSSLPFFVAAWAPSALGLFLAMAILFHVEDA